MRKYAFIICISFLSTITSYGSEPIVDSLKRVIENATNDSIKVEAYVAWDNLIYWSDPDLDYKLNLKIRDICLRNLNGTPSQSEAMFFKSNLAFAYNNLGIIHKGLSEFNKAIDYYFKSLELRKELADDSGIAGCLNNIGGVYDAWSKYDSAVYYYNESIEINIKLGNKPDIITSVNNIGNVYADQGNYINAIQTYTRALGLCEIVKDSMNMAKILNNIGSIHVEQNDEKKALLYFKKSYLIDSLLGNKVSISTSVNNIGVIYNHVGNYELAKNYFFRSLLIKQELDDKIGLASTYDNLGILYRDMGIYDTALFYHDKAESIYVAIDEFYRKGSTYINKASVYEKIGDYSLAVEICKKGLENVHTAGWLHEERQGSEILYRSYEKMRDFKSALKYYELYIKLKDSIYSDNNQKAIIEHEFRYEYEKQHLSDSLDFIKQKELDDIAHESEMEKEAQQRYGLFGGLGFLFLLGALSFRGYRRKKKDNDIITAQKEEVEIQKEIIEETHKEITDSIAYAKRIQSAILPPDRLIKNLLKDAFVLYKPKDVVAGDFYWIEPVISDNTVLFAAADCTGHGVPGALVSVVCNNALNRAVREFGLTEPGMILDKTREIVIEEFEKSEEEVKDGMDIALCNLGLQGLEDLGGLRIAKLKYAGANNPLWIIRKGSNQVEEIKADKQPIGKFDHPKPYQTHKVELNEGDKIYIFTDGYADQFGGEKARPNDSVGRGKKFKAANMKKLLLSIQSETMENQKKILDDTIENWKGNMEQIDDICLIGLRI